ncbi:DUF6078 family protein [Parabacteroides sp. OttesenSCG-928-G06]|nr:DUF6078 family protein [Parabacteroides sp. OttesenSCG-928-K15]MDL2282351.1 DUF6078 family protein [Parabacteroides sp. OttesenSCG-928-G06]MDL2282354.1 DUF6078 family protein [Parabacteroides sp. OttesenSCG-928-G06]
MKEDFNYKEIPGGYLHCLNAECSRSVDCLRYQVTLHVDQETPAFSVLNSGYVAARGECPFFQPDSLTRFALGMKHLFDNVPYAKALKIRNALYHYFERSMYYRIRNKTRLITPNEQAYIRQVFRKEGVQEEPVFDEYIEKYDW